MPPEVIWTAGAERDLLNLYQNLFDAFDADTGLIGKILEAPLQSSLDVLREFPEIAPRVAGAARVRRKIFGPSLRYGLFYTVENRGIIVHAVFDLRQDPQVILRRIRGI